MSLGKYFKEKYSVSAFVAAFSIFLLSSPYFVWGVFKNHYIWGFVILLCFALFAKGYRFDRKNSQSMFLFWGLVLLTLIFVSNVNYMGAIPYLSLLFIPFARPKYLINIKNSLVDIIAVFLVISLLVYLLVFLGFPLPSTIIPPLNELKDYDYIAYPFLLIPTEITDFFRFHAFWDEPGCVGTYTVLLLGINGFKFKGWQNITFLISGILSLSFFFFAVVLMVIAYKNLMLKTSNLTRFVTIGFFVAIIAAMMTKDTLLYDAIGWRFEYDDSTGKFAGDNRVSDAAKDYLASIAFKKDEFFWGVKKKWALELLEGGSSYIHGIFIYGFVAFAMYMSFFVIMAIRNIPKKTNLILFLLIMCGCVYQRPGIADIVYVFLYISWIRLSSMTQIESKPNKIRHESSTISDSQSSDL